MGAVGWLSRLLGLAAALCDPRPGDTWAHLPIPHPHMALHLLPTRRQPDHAKYPSMKLAYAAGHAGGTMTGVMSAANEQVRQAGVGPGGCPASDPSLALLPGPAELRSLPSASMWDQRVHNCMVATPTPTPPCCCPTQRRPFVTTPTHRPLVPLRLWSCSSRSASTTWTLCGWQRSAARRTARSWWRRPAWRTLCTTTSESRGVQGTRGFNGEAWGGSTGTAGAVEGQLRGIASPKVTRRRLHRPHTLVPNTNVVLQVGARLGGAARGEGPGGGGMKGAVPP